MSGNPESNSRPLPRAPVSVRLARANDLPAILSLDQQTPSAAHWSLTHYQSRIQSQPQAACFLVADCQGEVCAFLCARTVAGEWEIENVVVSQNRRRQGIGAELMQALIARWQDAAGTALLLEVRESNAAARALYERFGLREVGRRPAYYRDPVESAILYTRKRPAS